MVHLFSVTTRIAVRTMLPFLVILLILWKAAAAATAASYDCFETTQDLHAAVDAVLWNRQRLTVSPDYTPLPAAKAVRAVYGPTLGDWCLSPRLTNLSHTFAAHRNPLARRHFGRYAEDAGVGRWNVSHHVADVSHMFDGAQRFDADLCDWALPADAAATAALRGTACPLPEPLVAGVAACRDCTGGSGSSATAGAAASNNNNNNRTTAGGDVGPILLRTADGESGATATAMGAVMGFGRTAAAATLALCVLLL